MSIYGQDFAGVEDLDPNLQVVDGPMSVAVAVARRLVTPQGALFYDRDYGYDVRRLLHRPIRSLAEVSFRIEAEALKDERVESARVRLVAAGSAITIGITLELADGPYAFSLRVTQLNVQLLLQA